MLYELLFQLIYHDPIRIYNGRIWEVMEKNEKESSVTMVLYKVTKKSVGKLINQRYKFHLLANNKFAKEI